MVAIVKLEARKLENAWRAGWSLPAIPAGLAAAVEELSDWLHNETLLDLLLRTEGGGQLTADLQRTFCVGDLLARFCSADGVAQNSAAVAAFLLGLCAIRAVVPGLAVDYAALMALGVHIDSALTIASQQHDPKEGVDSLTSLQQLRQAYVRVVGNCMLEARIDDLCGLALQGAVMEALLHLTLGELSAACQLAEGRHSCRAEPAPNGSAYLAQSEQPALRLQPHEHSRAASGHAAQLLNILFSLAREEAREGCIKLQRLIGFGADLVEVLNQHTSADGQLTSLQPGVLSPAVDGLGIVLCLQLGVVKSLRHPSKAEKAALQDVFKQRMQWVGAAAALAKVLHQVADTAVGGSTAQQRGLASEVACSAWTGLHTVILLMQDVYSGHYAPGHSSNASCLGKPGGFAMVPGAVEPLLELAELLLRLVAKLPALAGLWVSFDTIQDQHEPAKFLWAIGVYIITDLTVAPSHDISGASDHWQPGHCGKGDRSRGSSSSGGGGGGSSSSSLSTGFLAFLCLPAVSWALGCQDLQAKHLLAANQRPANNLYNLLVQLRELHLVDDAVWGGGLGPLLKHYLQKLLGADHMIGAMTILTQLGGLLEAKHAEALAVTLVKDGLLQATAEYCLGLVTCQNVKGADGMLLSVAMLLRAVCALLDDNASTELLTTFSSLLKDVPPLQACNRTTGSHGSNDVFMSVPRGPWFAKYKTETAWTKVCSKLLPALSRTCEALAEGSQKEQHQDGIFRDVAVSAWTCCNPACTNMASHQEASLALSKCTGCGEARYCSK
ncbi:hypothetical protein N2152v2_002713 [Parachlorella kessleri]